jgi:hypothetical protein
MMTVSPAAKRARAIGAHAQKCLAIHRRIELHRRSKPAQPQADDPRRRLPMSVRACGLPTFAAPGAPEPQGHVGRRTNGRQSFSGTRFCFASAAVA